MMTETRLQQAGVSSAGPILSRVRYKYGYAVAAILLMTSFVTTSLLAAEPEVAVLEFELHDLTLYPAVEAEAERVASLRPLLVARLTEHHELSVVDIAEETKQEAAKGAGYLFDRPKLAAKHGKASGAPWVVSGRLHKASHLFVYLKAQLINTDTGVVSADFVVEIKGAQKKLTAKGVEALAQQISEALVNLNPNR